MKDINNQDNDPITTTTQNHYLRMLNYYVKAHEIKMSKLTDYVDYLAEKLDHSINYHDYIAENLRQAIELKVFEPTIEDKNENQETIKTFDEMETLFMNGSGIKKL